MSKDIYDNLIIDPYWPSENPAGDGGSVPAPDYPAIVPSDPNQGDSEEDDAPTGPDPINNSVKNGTSPDIYSR